MILLHGGKNVICRTIEFMKRVFSVLPLLFILVVACKNEDKKDDKNVVTAAPVDTIAVDKLPPIEKEFGDTTSTPTAAEAVLLKFNLQKGKVYRYTMNFDIKQSKGENSRSSNMKWTYDMQVIDEKSNVKTIKTTYKRIDMTMNMGNDQKMEFSSEKEDGEMDLFQLPSKIFKTVKGKSFTMQVNEKGEIVSVSGFDKIGEAVVSEMNFPDEMKPMIQQNFKKQFSDETVKELFSQIFSVFPNKRIKAGDSWKTKTPAFGPGQAEMTTTYTVNKIIGNRVFVTGQSKEADKKSEAVSQTSKLIIDARTGLVLDGSFTQKSEGAVSTGRVIGKEL
jgi:hypothetical protein